MLFIGNCKHCGEPFATKEEGQQYCSRQCRYAAKRAERGVHTDPVRPQDFPPTPHTRYLCHKWRREGWSVREIARMLNRTEASVERFLREKTTYEEEVKIRQFFSPKRMV